MIKKMTSDPFLDKRLEKYDEWIENNQISFSSKVISVTESLEAQKWVLPTEQAMQILRSAESLAVQPCECRIHYHRCDNPIEVCLVLNPMADILVARGKARRFSLEEAAGILKLADTHGLVHLSLYMPDHQVYALCSCCACCCHDLQLVQKFGRADLLVRSEYRAQTDTLACDSCGTCVDRCPFKARQIIADGLDFIKQRCTGCGLCVTACPGGAITMRPRR